jgi:hypothetical protein
MLKILLTTALGLTAAITVAVEAEGCRIQRTTFSSEPVIANFVHSAASIELARVVNVEPLPLEDRIYGTYAQTHNYTFETVTVLYGHPDTRFRLLGADPVHQIESYLCGTEIPTNIDNYDDHRIIQSRVCLSERGHAGWDTFLYRTNLWDSDGMGGVATYDRESGNVRLIIGCGRPSKSFSLGELYLIFRSEDGTILDGGGLNLRLIRAPHDQWLEAVQYFVANPDARLLPAIPAEDAINLLERARSDTPECVGHNDAECDPQTSAIWLRFRGAPWNEGLSPTPFKLPVADGIADLSGIPSQHAIEPSQVPFTDVIAWLSEAPETESPQ